MARKSSNRKRRTSVLQVSAASSAASSTGLPAGAFFLFGGLCLLVAGWGVWLIFGWMNGLLFKGNDRFLLRRIEARSDGLLSAETLEEWSGLESGVNLYELELPELRRRLESHAIIRRAMVRRKLPDTLELSVNERVPIARMGRVEGRMNWLLDRDGVLIEKKILQSKHLPFLVGVRQDVTMGEKVSEGPAGPALACIEQWRVMPSKMRELLPLHVISVGHPDYLDVRTKDGFQILLPRVEEYEELLERASRTVFGILERGEPERKVDLTPEGRNVIVGPK